MEAADYRNAFRAGDVLSNWLVGNDEPGLLGERASDCDTLLLSPRQAICTILCVIQHPDPFQALERLELVGALETANDPAPGGDRAQPSTQHIFERGQPPHTGLPRFLAASLGWPLGFAYLSSSLDQSFRLPAVKAVQARNQRTRPALTAVFAPGSCPFPVHKHSFSHQIRFAIRRFVSGILVPVATWRTPITPDGAAERIDTDSG